MDITSKIEVELTDVWAFVNKYIQMHYDEYKKEAEEIGEAVLPIYTVANNMLQLIGMHCFMQGFNDETYVVDWWFYEWPDGCKEDEVFQIACDKTLFRGCLQAFGNIMANVVEKNDMYLCSYVGGKFDEDRPQAKDDDLRIGDAE